MSGLAGGQAHLVPVTTPVIASKSCNMKDLIRLLQRFGLCFVFFFSIAEAWANETSYQKHPTDALEAALEQATTDTERMRLHFELAYSLRASNPVKAKRHSRQLIALSKQRQDTFYLAKGWRGLAKSHRALSEYDSAENIFHDMAVLWETTKDTSAWINALNDLGWLENIRGNPEQAITYGIVALELNQQAIDSARLSRTYALLGSAYKTSVYQLYVEPYPNEAKALLDKAVHYQKQALGLNLDLNRPYAKSVAMNLGNLCALIKRYQEALWAFEKADSLINVHGFGEDSRADLDLNRALLHWDMGDRTYADSVFHARSDYFEQTADGVASYKFFNNFQRLMVAQGKTEEALKLAQLASQKAQEAQNLFFQVESSVRLARAHAALSDHQAAAETWETVYQMMLDEDKVELRKNADELVARYEARLKEEEINRLKLEQQLGELERQRQKVGLGFAIAIILMLIWVAIAVYQRSEALKTWAEQKLAAGANELELLRANLKAELKAGVPVFAMDHISHKVNDYLLAPLTERELEVLMLLSKGLPNRAISEQLHISPNTTKTHIARIYDKLDVNNRTQAAQKASNLRLLNHLKD